MQVETEVTCPHDLKVMFADTLRNFVHSAQTLPPNKVYELHPIFEDLVDLLVVRRASWDGAFEGEACEILRSFMCDDVGLFCLGGDRDALLEERAERIAYWRQNPKARFSKWRENARLRTLVAELLDTKEPTDPLTANVWFQVHHSNYVPHVSQLTRNVGWQA
jgi:hypothetical protein